MKAAAAPIATGSAPKIWTPIGRSASSNRRYSRVRTLPRRTPSALTNSLTTTSAPNRRQSRRNGDSLTPAWGASQSGTLPSRSRDISLSNTPAS